MVAAPTTSLPERIGGDRNYDYRYSWVRDTNLAADALLRVGYRDDVHGSFSWLLRAAERTHPRLRPFYSLDASPGRPAVALDAPGYRDTTPVRAGNDAWGQLQLGTYGDLFTTAALWVRDGHHLGLSSARRLSEVADFLTTIWRRPDAGFWELPDSRAHTQSKIACRDALHNATRLAELGHVPSQTASRLRSTKSDMRRFVEARCWSDARESYQGRLIALLYRTSRLSGHEGAFVPCSFWLAEALARTGSPADAHELIDDLVGYASDVGLFSEEIDPATGAFVGNMPQALTHIALINAALELRSVAERRTERPGQTAAR